MRIKSGKLQKQLFEVFSLTSVRFSFPTSFYNTRTVVWKSFVRFGDELTTFPPPFNWICCQNAVQNTNIRQYRIRGLMLKKTHFATRYHSAECREKCTKQQKQTVLVFSNFRQRKNKFWTTKFENFGFSIFVSFSHMYNK